MSFYNKYEHMIFLLLMVLGLYSNIALADELEIILDSPKKEYIIREPIKFIVTMSNVSNSDIRIPEISYLDSNMEYMYFEITTPDGLIESRKYQYELKYLLINPNYIGEPLKPNRSIVTFLYPNITYSIEDPHMSTRATFPIPGVYTVRAVYFIPEYRKNLWRSESGAVYSNSIRLVFREPKKEERIILDAIWSNNGRGVSYPDNYHGSAPFSKDDLINVIAAYPNSDLMKYAYFSLARTLIGPEYNNFSEAANLLERISNNYPDFRYEEVRQHRAECLFKIGKVEEARKLFNETLITSPGLRNSSTFMMLKILVDSNMNHSYLAEYWRRRSEGENIDEYYSIKEEK